MKTQVKRIVFDENGNDIIILDEEEFTDEQVSMQNSSRLLQLDAEYTPQFRELQQAWAAANLKGNTVLAAEIQADYAALEAEYQQKREAIIND